MNTDGSTTYQRLHPVFMDPLVLHPDWFPAAYLLALTDQSGSHLQNHQNQGRTVLIAADKPPYGSRTIRTSCFYIHLLLWERIKRFYMGTGSGSGSVTRST